MDKKTYDSHSEAEYQFQEPEADSHFIGGNNETEKVSAIFERTKRHHIFLVVIVIFAVLGIYKLVDIFFLSTASTSNQKAIKKLQKQTDQVTIAKAAAPAEDSLTSHLTQLEQQQQDVQSSLKSLDAQISDMQTTLTNFGTRLDQLDNQTQALQDQQTAFIQKQEQSEKKVVAKKKEAPKPVYYVRAMIPGRAWLTTEDGSTLTLGLGSKLPGYGVIKSIDPDQGIVGLSSGAIIGYNPNDR